MPKQNELFHLFKLLTGYSQADISRRFGFTRQFISAELRNHSLTHKAAVAHYLISMIDERISDHEKQVEELKRLKAMITDDVLSVV